MRHVDRNSTSRKIIYSLGLGILAVLMIFMIRASLVDQIIVIKGVNVEELSNNEFQISGLVANRSNVAQHVTLEANVLLRNAFGGSDSYSIGKEKESLRFSIELAPNSQASFQKVVTVAPARMLGVNAINAEVSVIDLREKSQKES